MRILIFFLFFENGVFKGALRKRKIISNGQKTPMKNGPTLRIRRYVNFPNNADWDSQRGIGIVL